jgi:hypothetical protein
MSLEETEAEISSIDLRLLSIEVPPVATIGSVIIIDALALILPIGNFNEVRDNDNMEL